MIITFAPYGNLPYGTTQAYKDLQSCLAKAGVNIDYIIFQTYSIDGDLPMSATVLTDQTAALTKAQARKLSWTLITVLQVVADAPCNIVICNTLVYITCHAHRPLLAMTLQKRYHLAMLDAIPFCDCVVHHLHVLSLQLELTVNVNAVYAPIKIIAGFSNGLAAKYSAKGYNLVSQLYQPLLSAGTVTGASVFDADASQIAYYYSSSAFSLEQSLWGSAGK